MRGQIVGTGAQQTWRRLTSAPVGNTPIGTIHAIYTNVCPTGYLPCDGSAYDTTQFPDLYALLTTAGVANPDHTPDFRECALVGVGNNSTDTFGTHDIYTLGQFKDCQAQDGSLGLKSAGYNVSGNNVTLNTTVNASNRKLVTQYVADASATDLQTITTGSSGALTTRNRSKGVYFIIKAIVGNEVSDINQLADDLRAEMALCLQLKIVDTLPTGTDVTTDMYLYNGAYYMGQVDEADPTQSVCVPIGGGGTGNANIFVGTQAEWDALSTAEKNEYSQASITDVNSVVHVPVDTVADGNMNPVTSNAVFDSLYLKGTSATEILNVSRETTVAAGIVYNYTTTATIPTDGWYKFQVQANMKDNAAVISNWVKFNIGTTEVVSVATFQPAWNNKTNTVIIPVKAGTVVTYKAYCEAHAAGSGIDITYGNYGSVYKIA